MRSFTLDTNCGYIQNFGEFRLDEVVTVRRSGAVGFEENPHR